MFVSVSGCDHLHHKRQHIPYYYYYYCYYYYYYYFNYLDYFRLQHYFVRSRSLSI